MQNSIVLVGAVLALTVVGAGCSTARKVVIRPGQGGTVAIPDSEARRGRAESIMDDVCKGKKWRVVEERQSVAGNVVEKSVDKSKDLDLSELQPATQGGRVSDNSTRRSREEYFQNLNEWRISFECY